jgi:hypothetical protein
VRPSPPPYGTVRRGRCQFRDTMPPLSYGRRTAPSKEDGRTLEGGGTPAPRSPRTMS